MENLQILNPKFWQSTEQLKIASGNGKRSQLTNRCCYLGCCSSFTRPPRTNQSIGGLNTPELSDWQWGSCGNLISLGLENISDSAGVNSHLLNNALHEQNATSFCKRPSRSVRSSLSSPRAGQRGAIRLHNSYLNPRGLQRFFSLVSSATLTIALQRCFLPAGDVIMKPLLLRTQRGVYEIPLPWAQRGSRAGGALLTPKAETSFPPGHPHGSSPGVCSKRAEISPPPLLPMYLVLPPLFFGHRSHGKQQPETFPRLPVPFGGSLQWAAARAGTKVVSALDIPHPTKAHDRLPQFPQLREARSCQPMTSLLKASLPNSLRNEL